MSRFLSLDSHGMLCFLSNVIRCSGAMLCKHLYTSTRDLIKYIEINGCPLYLAAHHSLMWSHEKTNGRVFISTVHFLYAFLSTEPVTIVLPLSWVTPLNRDNLPCETTFPLHHHWYVKPATNPQQHMWPYKRGSTG